VAQLGFVIVASLTGAVQENNQRILLVLVDDPGSKKEIGNRIGPITDSRPLELQNVCRRRGAERQNNRDKQDGCPPGRKQRGRVEKTTQEGGYLFHGA
jgi:hypothetical protein